MVKKLFEFFKKKMTRKRAVRSAKNLRKSNLLEAPARGETVRAKAEPNRSRNGRKKSAKVFKRVKECRQGRSAEEKQIASAIETAAQAYRACIHERGGAKPRRKPANAVKRCRRACAKKLLQPKNFQALKLLIPSQYRRKPTEELRQKIIYVDPALKVCRAWSLGEVEYFEKHKERNWYVVRRQLRTTARSSPYVAIDSMNVYMAPTKEAPFVLENFSNIGVYVLYSDFLDEWYVGEAGDIQKRLLQHADGTGARWVKRWRGEFRRYPTVTPSAGPHEVLSADGRRVHEARERVLLEGLYGRDKVRGGGFTLSQ